MSTSYITDQTPAGDFESVTVSTTAIGCTSTKIDISQTGGFHKRAVKILCTVEDASIRIRYDGTDPTASVGHLFSASDFFIIQGEQNISRLRMIRSGGTNGVVRITYFYNY